MKRLIAMLLVILMLFAVTACAKPSDQEGQDADDSSQENTTLKVWYWG